MDTVPQSPYPDRRRRAIQLMGTRVAAEEILGFLVGLAELQSRVYDWAIGTRVADGARVPPTGPELRVDLARLPAAALVAELRRFCGDTAPIATPVLAAAARSLAGAGDSDLESIFGAYVRHESLSAPATALGLEEAPLAFFPRAFLQPVAETLRTARSEAAPGGTACPTCGGPPILSTFRDEPEKKNARYLCCSVCAQEWGFQRLTCALCGETATEALAHHVSEDAPHVRVDECRSCGRYLKGIDLRTAGSAVPVVDEIATVELDLWASERGLRKGCPNLLGF